MRARVGSVLLLVLTGCRDPSGSADPASSREAQAEGVRDATLERPRVEAYAPAASPAPTPAPAEPAEAEPAEPPAPPAERFIAEEHTSVGGLPVAVRIDERPPATEDASPTRTLLVSIGGATRGDRLLSLPTSFEHCERFEAVVEPVDGEPSPLVLAQAFCERGEDEFSRDILSAVVHVGDAATPPRVLWQGEGSFSSSFGVCQEVDVPVATVPRAGALRVQQLTEVVFDPDPDLSEIRCRAKKARRRTVAEIAF